MSIAYMLFHDHVIDRAGIDTKLLGIYRSYDDAHEAISRFHHREGFCQAKEGFRIETPQIGLWRFCSGFKQNDDPSHAPSMQLSVASTELLDIAYVVYHEYENPGYVDNIRFIGIFASNRDAKAAVGNASVLPGFNDHLDGFTIDPYTVGQDHWIDGYVTVQ